ncbi:hypothetical protein T01_2579 [Trichinella spiralis]|uniref:Uncharacterized protein n=1 Tax=Trichinella spiralis TaxID=6334 RepID=A0A0V1BGF2_TRISP|nr:hypothetical protein T01_2579 [Trichinella spiralis]
MFCYDSYRERIIHSEPPNSYPKPDRVNASWQKVAFDSWSGLTFNSVSIPLINLIFQFHDNTHSLPTVLNRNTIKCEARLEADADGEL